MQNPFDLTGRVVVVTAGCAGIGATVAHTLSELGAKVVSTSRDLQRARAFQDASQGRIAARQLSFDEDAVRRFVGEVVGEFGAINALINTAAGRAAGLSVEATGVDAMMAEYRDSCLPAFLFAQAVVAAQEQTKISSIVNVGSIHGSLAVDHRIYDSPDRQTPLAYACAKGALIQMTRYLAAYWAPRGVRVNCLSLGGVRRNQDPEFLRRYGARIPLGRMAEPAEVASAAAFLASDASSYVTGIDMPVDGGLAAW